MYIGSFILGMTALVASIQMIVFEKMDKQIYFKGAKQEWWIGYVLLIFAVALIFSSIDFKKNVLKRNLQ